VGRDRQPTTIKCRRLRHLLVNRRIQSRGFNPTYSVPTPHVGQSPANGRTSISTVFGRRHAQTSLMRSRSVSNDNLLPFSSTPRGSRTPWDMGSGEIETRTTWVHTATGCDPETTSQYVLTRDSIHAGDVARSTLHHPGFCRHLLRAPTASPRCSGSWSQRATRATDALPTCRATIRASATRQRRSARSAGPITPVPQAPPGVSATEQPKIRLSGAVATVVRRIAGEHREKYQSS